MRKTFDETHRDPFTGYKPEPEWKPTPCQHRRAQQTRERLPDYTGDLWREFWCPLCGAHGAQYAGRCEILWGGGQGSRRPAKL